ncbi:MAG TPA: hypothetical protein VK507_25700, partial [Iamia sp.]|nr:hypothetical protein [Iamia sp.]
ALGDVEPIERQALLADLRLHLDEVVREDVRRLDDIVGPPEVYAEELRAAAGLTAPAPALFPPPDPPLPPTAAAWPWVREQMRRGWRVVAEGGRDIVEAAREAMHNEPAWWLLRAFLAVHALGAISLGGQGSLLLPRVMGQRSWGLVAAFACAVVSVRVGRDPDRVPLRVVRIANVMIVVIGGIAVLKLGVA